MIRITRESAIGLAALSFSGALVATMTVAWSGPPASGSQAAAGVIPPDDPRLMVKDVVDEDGCAYAKAEIARWMHDHGVSVEGPPRQELMDANTETDVQHYTLDIEIDIPNKWIGGSNTIDVNVVEPGVSTFPVRIGDFFNLPTIEVNGSSAAMTRLDPQTIEITLDHTYGPGESFMVYIEYDGHPKSDGFGSIEFTTHNNAPAAWTLSETWYAYTWWPAKDINTDKATADFYFTVNDDEAVASQGVLQEITDLGNGKLQYHWKTDYPTATYLYSLAVTNYTNFAETFDYDTYSMPVEFFVYPESDNSNNRNLLAKTVDMLGVFSDQYGLYPFINEKYGIVQFGWGGGMEHQTMTSQSSFSEWLSAHELSHQWWGDCVTCGTWHDIWLNEGFATYSEAIWYEFRNGQNRQELINYMAGRRPSRMDGSVYVYDASNLNRIFNSNFSYRKGGWVLHMLRHVIGDDNFFQTLADYRSAHEYDSAITDEFIAAAENVWGDDLSWFFDPWVYDIGAAEYQYAWKQYDVNGRTFVDLDIRQVQGPDFPLFPMPIDVQTNVGGNKAIHVAWNDAAAEHLLFEVNEPIDGVVLDPEEWVLSTDYRMITFAEGPPKVVSIAPRTNRKGLTNRIDVTFHKDVVAGDLDFSLVGDQVGAVPFSVQYNATHKTATIVPAHPLLPDTYVLTAFDSIVDVASGKALDGELDAYRWWTEPTFPSGDGLPGGDAVVQFDVNYDAIRHAGDDGLIEPIDVQPIHR